MFTLALNGTFESEASLRLVAFDNSVGSVQMPQSFLNFHSSAKFMFYPWAMFILQTHFARKSVEILEFKYK